ncbi:MAG: hypothetical protein LBE91_21865 [Tannerella sp.]|jgi:hypothetical protein|nr:hypothetical protein [Tannerella sp.]
MKRIIFLPVYCVWIFYILPVNAYGNQCGQLPGLQEVAQATAEKKDDPETLLQGTWVLEDVSVSEVNNARSIGLDDENIEIYAELEIRQDSILFLPQNSLKTAENFRKTTFTVDDRELKFGSSMKSVYTEWGIANDRLYLLWRFKNPENELEIIFVNCIYKRK